MGIQCEQTQDTYYSSLSLQAFKGKHKDRACLVCGTGPSLSILKTEDNPFAIIGVNAISRYVKPKYLVISDRIGWQNKLNYSEEIQRNIDAIISENKAEYTFSKWSYPNSPSEWVKTEFYGIDCISAAEIIRTGKIFSSYTSTISAIGLACWMGFRFIGLLGFDLAGHPVMQHRVREINSSCQRIMDYAKETGRDILNLSADSLVEPFPKVTFKEFKDWYEDYA